MGKVFTKALSEAGGTVHNVFSGTFNNSAVAVGHRATAQITNDLSQIVPLLDQLSSRRTELGLPKDQDTQLADAIQTVKQEAQKSDPKPSVVSSSLKVVKDIAVKVVEKAAQNAVPEHLWQPLHD